MANTKRKIVSKKGHTSMAGVLLIVMNLAEVITMEIGEPNDAHISISKDNNGDASNQQLLKQHTISASEQAANAKSFDLGIFIFVSAVVIVYGIYLLVQKCQEKYGNNNILDDLKDDSFVRMQESYSSLEKDDQENILNEDDSLVKVIDNMRQINVGNGLQSNQKATLQNFKFKVNAAEYINASTSDFEGMHQSRDGVDQMLGNLGDSTIIFHDDSVMLESRVASKSFFKDENEEDQEANRAQAVRSNVNLLEELNLNNGSDQQLKYFSQVHESPVKNIRELYQTNDKNHFFVDTPDTSKQHPQSPIKPYITDKFRNKITQISIENQRKLQM